MIEDRERWGRALSVAPRRRTFIGLPPRGPWVHPDRLPVHHARTWIVYRGPEVVRAADTPRRR